MEASRIVARHPRLIRRERGFLRVRPGINRVAVDELTAAAQIRSAVEHSHVQARQLDDFSQLIRRRRRHRRGLWRRSLHLHCRSLGRGRLDVAGRRSGGPGERAHEVREVEYRRAALDAESRHVVGPGGHLRRGEGAEPDARLLAGLADFRHPLAPRALADAVVDRMAVAVACPLLSRGLLGGLRGRRSRWY
ncbi:dehydration-responsive element-binding protein 3-like [Iris pallida]|uniref:Dehydration-responsive element-binding protein 3-like n=1 Tax=Iris pallida TaxID=29817 RepID=A0AAX6HN70_IRIPA|nr:dehydration-responsive element-binding protein 3-like [Iris pallida]